MGFFQQYAQLSLGSEGRDNEFRKCREADNQN